MLRINSIEADGENLQHYIATVPFEVDGIVYIPPEYDYSQRSEDEVRPYVHSAPMVEPRMQHNQFCSLCERAKQQPDELIVIE